MSTPDPIKEEQRALMMAVLDDEANAEQVGRFQALLETNPALRQEYEELASLKELTMYAKPEDPGNALWKTYWAGVYRRLERGLGWLLFSAGAVVLILYGAWQLAGGWLTNDSVPVLVRLAGALLGIGAVILLVSVIREQFFFHKRERYKDIER